MSMDFSSMGSSRIEGNARDLGNRVMPQRALIIEVVILDLTHPGKMAYQLLRDTPFSDEELKLIKQGIISIHHDAFAPIGEVSSIDKKTKQLVLADQNTISYTHLIVVTGKQPTILSYEFLAGVHTLIDALRMNKTISSAMSIPNPPVLNFNISISEDHDKKIEELGTHKLPTQTPEQATVLVSELNKKLYQVQI